MLASAGTAAKAPCLSAGALGATARWLARRRWWSPRSRSSRTASTTAARCLRTRPGRQPNPPRDPPSAACSGVNWMCVGGYNHVAFYGNMAVVVLVFAELRWRRWLCAKKSRRGTAIDKK